MEKGSILGLGHVGIFITDMERSKAFYRDVLDFDCVYEYTMEDGTQIAFIRNGDCTLELVRNVSPEQRVDGWVDHVAFRVRNIEAVQAALVQRGLSVYDSDEIVHNPKCFPGGAKWVLFRGPDGEHLEITEVL